MLQAIRENSDRPGACGYDINRVKLPSSVFSSLFMGLAGALDALRLTVVPSESLHWSTAGRVVIMTVLGGAGTFFGPFVGAAAFLVLELFGEGRDDPRGTNFGLHPTAFGRG